MSNEAENKCPNCGHLMGVESRNGRDVFDCRYCVFGFTRSTPPSVEAGAVPDAMEIDPLAHTKEKIYRNGWNACREAMLNSATTPTASAECDHKFYPFGDQIKERRCVSCNKLDRNAPASAGGLDKEAVINLLQRCEENPLYSSDAHEAFSDIRLRIEAGDFDLPKQGGAQ